MKSIILSIGLLLVVAMSLGCDENNKVIAKEPGPMEPGAMGPDSVVTISGTVIDNNKQCDGKLDGFKIGDSILVEIFAGTEGNGPTAKVENMTKGTSVDCAGTEKVFDGPPISTLVCESENTTISAFKNGDFMSILISYTWVDSFKNDLDKSVFILAKNIDFVKDLDTKKAPCTRVKIESITASN